MFYDLYDIVQNRSFTMGLNPCKCIQREKVTLKSYFFFFFARLTHSSAYQRHHLEILDEIPGQELNEELVRTMATTTAKILRFQMPVKRPEGYCVTRAIRVILYRRRAGRKVFSPSPPQRPPRLFNGNSFSRK